MTHPRTRQAIHAGHARRRFKDRLDRARRMHASGREDMRWATANGWPHLEVPQGYTRADRASYALGAAQQRRDTVWMRGASGGLTTMGSPGRKRRKAKRDGTPDDTP